MKRHVQVALAAIVALGFTAGLAHAACDFEHPKGANKVQASLVQAFLSCGNPGGNSVNDTTQGGVPSCNPPETYHQADGSPSNGWEWDETSGKGAVSFKPKPNQVVNPLNPPGSQDIVVQLKMKGVLADDSPGGASGPGMLSTTIRWTMNDRQGDLTESGDDQSMTVVDFPLGFPFTLSAGKVKLKTSANVILNGVSQNSFPGCTSISLVDVAVLDENGTRFAEMGLFLKDEIVP